MANAWKIARKSNTQLPLVIVVALAVVLVLLGKAQSNLFDQARVGVSDRLAPLLEVARAPVRNFDRWLGSIGDIFSVYEENLRLKEENARLRQWHNVAIVMQNRVDRYQSLLHAVPDPKLNAVLARVIGRSSRPFVRTLILDAGTRNHASPGEAVVDQRGMIGRIYLSGNRTSWVILLTDPNSRIPVTVAASKGGGSAVQAIMSGDNSSMPALDLVSRTAKLHPGDQVVSSGDGGLLPYGLPIGTVVAGDGGAWRVALLADPASSQDVEILNYSVPPEKLPPEAELPADAAGLRPLVPPPEQTQLPPSPQAGAVPGQSPAQQSATKPPAAQTPPATQTPQVPAHADAASPQLAGAPPASPAPKLALRQPPPAPPDGGTE
ncbi:MAG TPA: rod shape-determining protein MreC [Rhizomicrobium sp.]|nr:rod shape-determining protein MreC [Rhizomicrobium sp.]